MPIIGTSGRHSSRSAFGQSTGIDVSGHYKHSYFPLLFHFPCSPLKPFFIEGKAGRGSRIKKLIFLKLTGAPKILAVDSFADPVGHFEAPWRPIWIFEVLIEGMIESKTYLSKFDWRVQ